MTNLFVKYCVFYFRLNVNIKPDSLCKVRHCDNQLVLFNILKQIENMDFILKYYVPRLPMLICNNFIKL